jgi:16S rRNA (guanine527-N7)-methyltransferase
MSEGRNGRVLPHIAGPEQFAEAFNVSRETLDRLKTYAALLEQWQRAVNLVAASTLPDVWHRHFADSAQLVRFAPAAKSWVDLGSGAGFPGMVVAILLAETNQGGVRLIESDARKCAFLREVARQTGVAVDIIGQRIETLSTQAKVDSVDVISARALAPLGRLLELSLPLFSRSTVGLFLKGRDVGAELEEAARRWVFDSAIMPSLTDAGGRVVQIRALRAKTED